MRLEGKIAIVTGAAAGIGRATAQRFAAEGASVVAVDLLPAAPGDDASVRSVQADVADPAAMAEVVRLAQEHGPIDICVANAGIAGIEDFVDGTVDSWSRMLRVNLLGAMVTLQAAARSMVAHGRGGRLLATGSIAALHGEAHAPAYTASKGGVVALMRALAVELAPHGITANAVAPGQIDTQLNADDVAVLSGREGETDVDDYRRRQLDAHVPLRRMGAPDEVAALFAFLASDDAAYITGETLRIDGGELAI